MRCSSQWLDWMVDRIQIREAELLELQKRTAEVLAETAEEERPPSPPKEENMHDPASMELYMQAMAVYSTRQRERLTCSADNSAAIAENREATQRVIAGVGYPLRVLSIASVPLSASSCASCLA